MGNRILKRINSRIFSKDKSTKDWRIKNFRIRFLIHFLLSLLSIVIVWVRGGVGLRFHLFILIRTTKLFVKRRISPQEFCSVVISPLDSFRYFEFHFGNLFVKEISKEKYLDLSSPRYFPVYLMEKYKIKNSQLLNPDLKDLQLTKELIHKLQLPNHVIFINKLIQDLIILDSSFDLITSISVLEHIPLNQMDKALDKIISLVKPNGHLLISLPVAKQGFDEYIDFNEYGLVEDNTDEFYFGQRFHDEELMNEVFYSKLGQPIKSKIVSENIENYFFRDRFQKINNVNYKKWIEPLRFFNNYTEVKSISDLKGIGVGIFLFQIHK